jgi:hypothetical protein
MCLFRGAVFSQLKGSIRGALANRAQFPRPEINSTRILGKIAGRPKAQLALRSAARLEMTLALG